jgi:polyhydroxyalkanoate synthesis repressor PhaR
MLRQIGHAAPHPFLNRAAFSCQTGNWDGGARPAALRPFAAQHKVSAARRRHFRDAQTAWNGGCFARILFSQAQALPAARGEPGAGRSMMGAKDEPVVIKKYANRRLYNTGTSTYVTLEDLADMVKRGEDFTVQDAKTGDDITHPVLTQIIFELENKAGQNMLPIPFLRQLIAFYGDQMQMIVPSFLEQSMTAFAKEQERFREQMKATLAKGPMDVMKMTTPMKALEEQTRRNMEMFQNAMRMFAPFPGASPASPSESAAKKEPSDKADDLQELKEQIAAMQRKIESLS